MDYGSLVQWACDDVFDRIQAPRKAALRRLAGQVRQHPCLRLIECGLEFHHDGSGRVDLLFHPQSRHLEIDGVELPDWWHRLVGASNVTDGSEVMSRFAAPAPAHQAAAHNDPWDIRPSGWHWLEFDLLDGREPRLAGVFQHCTAVTARDERSWERAIDHFSDVGCVDAVQLRRSRTVRSVLETFGIPMEWGFMVGRQESVKLVAALDAADWGRLDDRIVRHAPATSGGVNPFRMAVSLDVDLAADRLGDCIGVEIAGPPHDRRPGAVDANWRALDDVLKQWGVDGDARESCRHVYTALPAGIDARPRLGGLERLLADELRGFFRVAFHTHVKLVLQPGGKPPSLKSYVSLRTVRGGLDAARG